MCSTQNGNLTGANLLYQLMNSYLCVLTNDLAVGLTIIDAIHALHTSLIVHRSLACKTSIIPQPSVRSFHSDKVHVHV